MIANKNKQPPPQTMMVALLSGPPNYSLDLRKPQDEPKKGTMEELIELVVDSQEPNKIFKPRKNLEGRVKDKLETFIKENLDVFIWKHSNMVGISLKMMYYRLNIDPEKKLIWKKRSK